MKLLLFKLVNTKKNIYMYSKLDMLSRKLQLFYSIITCLTIYTVNQLCFFSLLYL
ncbi:hypothetical protein HanIR_Chr01g0002031 [Helianthus annuus]|nr:hypothetical protein HanIR_Chr01g0002031 [Helianthus annuus]